MFARYHGETPRVRETGDTGAPFAPAVAAAGAQAAKHFGFMFGHLTDDPANRLPEGPATIAALRELGAAMADDPSNEEGVVPAAYTYFGQFIDHDITKTHFPETISPPGGPDIIEAPNFAPLARAQAESLTNERSSPLDLDSVYGGLAEREATLPDGRMRLGSLSVGPRSIPTADRDHDLPRRPMIANPQNLEEQAADREALIGDPRNDENLLVGQLHVAFLRTFNKLLERFQDPARTQRELRRRYQWAVLHDFLPRIGDPASVQDILQNGPRVLKIDDPNGLFMPLEFSGAAYRFGHSMVRQEYNHNATFNPNPGALAPATFNFMFTFTALSGSISPAAGQGAADSPTLPDNWVIDWSRFFAGAGETPGLNPARRIDTRLAFELGQLPNALGVPVNALMGRLAARNLLRGYLLGLPTGQAVARALQIAPLSADVLRSAVPSSRRAAFEAAGFLDRTPLWFYLLAEAGDPAGADGKHLGPAGTRIVAETLFKMALHASDSVVKQPPSEAELATGEFTLRGIVRIGLDTMLPPI